MDKALAKIKEEKAGAEVMGLCPSLGDYGEVEKAIQEVKDMVTPGATALTRI